ncbi:hypothetical protein K504DRAFT_464898 [Pleomassaria siparia CBS 279.74]|uniref:Uncharacterized protein n=1 Tax=Pleomassaria siparia CBS 279.74 TaxID=1314801 RepID=A0A6G1JQ86_9PLEO|nr:hypothetical protein K504DRAFT_464898 [Pleomassaria siparia CBS 279.74]
MAFEDDKFDDSTIDTSGTPPESVVTDFRHDQDLPRTTTQPNPSSIPWPGSTFIIRSISDGHVITLLNGEITLAPPGGFGAYRWECVEARGWLGFREHASALFLGHDDQGNIACFGKKHLEWENFSVRMKPDGGYVLLAAHGEKHRDGLWPLGIKKDKQGVVRLVRFKGPLINAMSWGFCKV